MDELTGMQILLLCIIPLGIVSLFGSTQNINDRFENGIALTSMRMKKFLWRRKTDDYIAYPALVFVIIGYVCSVLWLACIPLCVFAEKLLATWLTGILFGIVFIANIIVQAFLPPYGTKGS